MFRYGMVAMFVFGRVSFSFRIISLILVSVLLLSVVSITTLIIAISCGMIGIGFNLKNAFSGMMDRQIQEVWGFDLKISYDEEVNDSKRKEMEKVITDSGATCASVAEVPTIYRDRDLQEYTYIMSDAGNASGSVFGYARVF